MSNALYGADSSTRLQTRQLDQDQQQFARLVADIKKSGAVPSDEDIKSAGTLANKLYELREDLQDRGIEGFNKTLQVMSKMERRITAALTWLEDQDQQAEQELKDARLTTGKKGKQVFKTLSMSDLKKLPPAKWIIPKIWQQVGTSLTYGDANTGKTFIDLDIALRFAYGMEWQGHVLQRLRVLYIFGEGDVGLATRVEAFQQANKLEDTDYIQFICFPVQLLTELSLLCATIEDQEKIPGLIVLDTFSVCAEGVPENDNTEVARWLNAASHIKRTYNTHVHVIHHAGKSGDYRGAAAFRGNVDTMILLSREDNNSPIVMSCKKQKDAEYFPDIYLQLEQVELGLDPETLEPITSCVVVPAQKAEQKEDTSGNEAKERDEMLELLRLHKRLSVNKWITECKSVGISKKAYYRHIKALKVENKVTYQEPAKNGLPGYFQLSAMVEMETLLQTSEV